MNISVDMTEEEVKQAVICDEKLKALLNGKEIVKFVYVKNRLVNIVVK